MPLHQRIQSIDGNQKKIADIIFASYRLPKNAESEVFDTTFVDTYPIYKNRVAVLKAGAFSIYKAQTQNHFVLPWECGTFPRLKSRAYGDPPRPEGYKFCLLYQKYESSYLLFGDSIEDLNESLQLGKTSELRTGGIFLYPKSIRQKTLELLVRIRAVHDQIYRIAGAGAELKLEDRLRIIRSLGDSGRFHRIPKGILRNMAISLDRPWPDGYTEYSFVASTSEFISATAGNRKVLCHDRTGSVLSISSYSPTAGLSRLGPSILVTVMQGKDDENCKFKVVDIDFTDKSTRRRAYDLWEV